MQLPPLESVLFRAGATELNAVPRPEHDQPSSCHENDARVLYVLLSVRDTLPPTDLYTPSI